VSFGYRDIYGRYRIVSIVIFMAGIVSIVIFMAGIVSIVIFMAGIVS